MHKKYQELLQKVWDIDMEFYGGGLMSYEEAFEDGHITKKELDFLYAYQLMFPDQKGVA